MKLVIRTVFFHIFCIILFAFVYYISANQFRSIYNGYEKNDMLFIDCFLLSTTIQAGVGVSDLYPLTVYSKVTVIIQQMLMLFTHVITLYIFTL